jgi:sacsin
MYPEGTQQLSELIQNADDAKATVVKFVVSTKQHGTSSLLGQNMSEWQGGALYCYNDATFSARDFKNLSHIGQASKLDKLVTTGRFGLGFNSVFHWTDVPSVVSADSLVMFDPHAKVSN